MSPTDSSDTAPDMSLGPPLDPRVHPYRDDIAADFLEGRIEAKNFVAGKPCRLGAAFAPVMSKPVWRGIHRIRGQRRLVLGPMRA